jgi:uncharacterized membrane protein
MEDQIPQPREEEDPIRTCAYTGERRPQSQMVRIGEHYVVAEYKDAAVQFLQQGNEFDPPSTDMDAPPVRFMPLLMKSWSILQQHWLLFLLIELTVALPLGIVDGFVAQQVDSDTGNMSYNFFSGIMNGVFTSVGHAAIFAAMARLWSGKAPSYGNAWFVTMARIGTVVLASCFVMALVTAGIFLCIIPGIIASVWLAFTLCIVIDEGNTAWPAVERSANIAKGRFWPILGYLLAVSLPLSVPLVMYATLSHAVPFHNHWLFEAVLLALLGIPLVFTQVFTFVLYKALRSAPTVVN